MNAMIHFLNKWVAPHAIMLLGLTTGLGLFAFQITGFNFAYFPGDLGDGRLNLYFLEHAHRFFTGKVSSFWDAPFMYPEVNVISYSDNLLGSAPIYSLFRILGFDIFKAYQLWYVAVAALNFITAFYFLKHVFKNNYAAVIGAFVFAFSIALQSQLTHAQTFPRFAIPLAFLMAVKFVETVKPKFLLFAILAVVYQIYCAIHLGFMLAVPMAIFLLLVFVQHRKILFTTRWLFRVLAFVFIGLMLLLPLMLPYMGRNIVPGIEHYRLVAGSLPTITSHFFSQQGSLVWDFLSETGSNHQAWWDHQIFAGGVATISLIFSMGWFVYYGYKSRFRFSAFNCAFVLLLLTGIFTFFLYLRWGETLSAYFFLYFFPGFSSMRSLTRIINIELIFFAIATAFVFSKILKHNFKLSPLFFILSLALIVADNYFHPDKSYRTKVSIAKERTEWVEKEFSLIPAGSIVSYEPLKMQSASIFYHLDAMLLSQKFGLRTINAYTATSPGDFNIFWHTPNERSRNYWLNEKKLSVDSIYVVKGKNLTQKVSVDDIQRFSLEAVKEERLQNLIKTIRADENWMRIVEEKAREHNISVDSMLLLDAKWIIESEN